MLSQLTPRLLSGTFRGFQRLKLEHDELLSRSAFNCILRPYTKAAVLAMNHTVHISVGRCRPCFDPGLTPLGFNAWTLNVMLRYQTLLSTATCAPPKRERAEQELLSLERGVGRCRCRLTPGSHS